MKILKRLGLFVFFLPVVLLCAIRWIITGESAGKSIDKFIEWCTDEPIE